MKWNRYSESEWLTSHVFPEKRRFYYEEDPSVGAEEWKLGGRGCLLNMPIQAVSIRSTSIQYHDKPKRRIEQGKVGQTRYRAVKLSRLIKEKAVILYRQQKPKELKAKSRGYW